MFRSKYLNHLIHMTVSQILSQCGIEKCSKNSLFVLSEVYIQYITRLCKSIADSNRDLLLNSGSDSLADGLLFLFEEFGYFYRHFQWNDLEKFLEKQVFFSKQIVKSCASVAEPPSVSYQCVLSLVYGLPAILDVEGKSFTLECNSNSSVTVTLANNGDEFYYSFLPPVKQNTGLLEALPVNEMQVDDAPETPVLGVQAPFADEKQNLKATFFAPRSESLLQDCVQLDAVFLAAASIQNLNSHKSDTNSIDFLSVCAERQKFSFTPQKLDPIHTVERRMFSVPLWISHDAPVLNFFAEATIDTESRLAPVILQQAEVKPSTVVVNITANSSNAVQNATSKDSSTSSKPPSVHLKVSE